LRVLVTGASGAAGSYMIDYLIDHQGSDVDIFALSRWHSTADKKNLDGVAEKIIFLDCDLTDMSSVIRALETSQPDIIFHFASHANVLLSFHNPLSVVQNNVNSTLNLLEGLRLLGMKPKFIAASTSEVYGKVKAEDLPLRETQLMHPMSPYGASKAFQDHIELVYFEAYGIPTIRTRMFTYINSRRKDLFASSWARQIVEIERGRRVQLSHGNLESVRTLLDVRDAMHAYWLSALYCEPGEAYNIGGTVSYKVGVVLEKLIGLSDSKINIFQDPSLMRPSDVTLQVPDCSKFHAATGWIPKHDIDDSLEFLMSETRNLIA
jgi:GDP-4-dehydro-6-deoxy-D-mannose reductase